MSEENIYKPMDGESEESIARKSEVVNEVIEKEVPGREATTGQVRTNQGRSNYNKSYVNKGQSQSDQNHKVPRFKKKICRFCHDNEISINYKKPELLERFITDRGKILPRRVTGTCAKHQRIVAREIKRARLIALLPFIEK